MFVILINVKLLFSILTTQVGLIRLGILLNLNSRL